MIGHLIIIKSWFFSPLKSLKSLRAARIDELADSNEPAIMDCTVFTLAIWSTFAWNVSLIMGCVPIFPNCTDLKVHAIVPAQNIAGLNEPLKFWHVLVLWNTLYFGSKCILQNQNWIIFQKFLSDINMMTKISLKLCITWRHFLRVDFSRALWTTCLFCVILDFSINL